MTINSFSFANVDDSWRDCLLHGLQQMDPEYLQHLSDTTHWLPGANNIFNAFSQPLDKVKYVLFGESPYPRAQSANGYAFWDAAVHTLWSPTGLSKEVNRATSLRNMLKMLLVAEGLLPTSTTSQDAIASLSKEKLIQTNEELFNHLLEKGFLLLNTTLVLQEGQAPYDAKKWRPFIQIIIQCLLEKRSTVTFLLWGNIAKVLTHCIPKHYPHILKAEHPYNLSFINNLEILNFFKPLHLLRREALN